MTPTNHMMLELLREVAANPAVSPELMVRVKEAVVMSGAQAEDEFRRLAPLFNVDPDWYGKMFRCGRKTFTVVGINMGRSKNPMAIRDQNGKVFRCTPDYVRAGRLREYHPPTPPPRCRSRPRGGRDLDLGV